METNQHFMQIKIIIKYISLTILMTLLYDVLGDDVDASGHVPVWKAGTCMEERGKGS